MQSSNIITMEKHDSTLTGQDSLKIIAAMISKTKVNIRQSSFQLIFWGWLITVISLAEYFLALFTDITQPWLVWTLTIPGVIVSLVYGFIRGSRQPVHTYAGRIYMWIWFTFIIAVSTLMLFLSGLNLMYKVTPFILLFAATAVFLSGIVLKYKPLIFGAISIWGFALIGFFAGPYVSPLAMPLAVITGYLIPGYMLRKTGKSHE